MKAQKQIIMTLFYFTIENIHVLNQREARVKDDYENRFILKTNLLNKLIRELTFLI